MMLMRQTTTVSLWFGFVLSATVAHGQPVPTVRDLLKQSDVVVMGAVTSVSDAGPASIQTAAVRVEGRRKSAAVAVDQILKGPATLGIATISFVVPDTFIGYRTIGQGEYRVLFLKQQGDTYEFASQYYPSIAAVPNTPVASGEIVSRLVRAEAEVLRSREAPAHLKREAIYALRDLDVRDPESIAALRSVSQHADESVRLTAIAALLAADESTALPLAANALLNPSPASADLLMGLRVAIRDHLSVSASTLPVLARLLGASDAMTRRAVSRALRRAHSQPALTVLATALDDADAEVAYNAVMGFAETTGQPERGTSMPAFVADRQRYLAYWKEWQRNR